MKGPKVVIYPDKAGEFRWRLVGGNGEIEAVGESHATAEHAEEAVTTVARNFAELCIGVEVNEEFALSEDSIERLTTEEAEGRGLEVG